MPSPPPAERDAVPPRPAAALRLPVPDKDQVALLPPFAGLLLSQIEVPDTPQRCAAAAAALLAAGVAGFDSESKPTFRVGEISDGPHTVQFALADRAYIFQVQRPACLEPLRALLLAPGLVKAGFGLASDRAQIQAKLGLLPQGVLDLNTLFVQRGYRRDIGVRSAVALAFGQRFAKSKKVTTTNWALPTLSASQLLYAANDAYAALRVWQLLQATPAPQALPHALAAAAASTHAAPRSRRDPPSR